MITIKPEAKDQVDGYIKDYVEKGYSLHKVNDHFDDLSIEFYEPGENIPEPEIDPDNMQAQVLNLKAQIADLSTRLGKAQASVEKHAEDITALTATVAEMKAETVKGEATKAAE